MQVTNLDDWKKLLINAPTRKAWKQVLAHDTVYQDGLKVGDIIEQPDYFKYAPMQVKDIISDHHGFRSMILIPTEKEGKVASSAMIIFQGTVPKFQSILDDMVHTIGSRSFQRNINNIKNSFEEIFNKYGPICLLGHSLGGAVAQLATLKFPFMVAKCRLYNAPGIQFEMKPEEFEEQIELFEHSKTIPKVVHVWHISDIVPYAGGKHLPANKMYLMGEFSTWNIFKSHSLLSLSEKDIKCLISHDPQISGMTKSMVEYTRSVGKFIPWVYDKVWGSSKQDVDLESVKLEVVVEEKNSNKIEVVIEQKDEERIKVVIKERDEPEVVTEKKYETMKTVDKLE